MHRLAAALLLMFAALPALAQPAPLSERMAPFARLLGEWRGTGWMMTPEGQRMEFQSHEIVTPRLSGNALLVEGRHFASSQPDRPVHDAMAMITWDARQNAWRFRSALATGTGGDFPITPREGGLTWSMDIPGGRIEYLIDLTDTTWHERGRRVLPDGRQIDFFEMHLTRQ